MPKLFAKKFLGIDIGTSSIKLVELEDGGQSFGLSNYGQIDLALVENEKPELSRNALAAFSSEAIAEMIQAVLAEAKIKTRQCAFSIPDFSAFFTAFSLPPMTEKELPEAVIFEARQHIPLPIESVTIDWQLVGGEFGKSQNLDITVAAVPNEIIAQYREIAAKAKLQVVLMEAEIFGLLQALVGKDDKRAICLVDVGTQSTVCGLVEKGLLRYSHSFDRGGAYLADEFIGHLLIDRETAADIRRNYGLGVISAAEPEIRERMEPKLRESLLPVFKEIKAVLDDYRRLNGSEVAKIIISGGASAIPGIKEQFMDYFQKEIEIADPFKGIKFHAEIEDELKNIGPAYAVAVGMARRGFEFAKHTK